MLNEKSIQLEYTAEFKRNLRTLSKKYRHIRSDVQPVLDQLLEGETPGDQIPHVGYSVFKARISNKDSQKGKRSGYRFVYYLKTPTRIILITIYSKADQSDISAKQIQKIIQSHPLD